jgi:hypothetical protein
VPQVLADESTQQRVRAFFRTLPVALERGDLPYHATPNAPKAADQNRPLLCEKARPMSHLALCR